MYGWQGSLNPDYHGMGDTKLYRIWCHMKSRCNNPNVSSYKWYGARGIKICEDWERFKPFMQWALNNGYGDELSLDRIDNDLGYTPENCRWVTMKQQQNNRRNNHKITIGIETKTLAEWADQVKIPAARIRTRIVRGWNPQKAVITPLGLDKYHPYCEWRGQRAGKGEAE